MAKAHLKKIKQRLIRDDVLSSLRAAILEGSFQVGEQLVETELAEQLGTSRGPVREALSELAREGLVVTLPYKGAVVAELSASDIREIYELRTVLESYATRLAVENATSADIDLLQSLYEEMGSAARAGDLSALVKKDVEFHRKICHLSGNTRLLEIWSSLAAQVRMFLVLADQVFFEPDFIVETHAPLLKAMRTKNPDLAERAVKKHMSEVGTTIMRAMEEKSA